MESKVLGKKLLIWLSYKQTVISLVKPTNEFLPKYMIWLDSKFR
jgi:hypothetical protein